LQKNSTLKALFIGIEATEWQISLMRVAPNGGFLQK
jgi:hypothetical protein